MPLVVPYASALSEAAVQVLRDVPLPRLQHLLLGAPANPQVACPASHESAELSFSPPHEAAIAQWLGWQGSDGRWPFAAWHAQQDQIDIGEAPWGELTPVHWIAGRDHVRVADPQALALDTETSRSLFAAIEPLFSEEGLRLVWGDALRWYVSAPELDGLRTASLDRVIGRNIDAWLPYDRAARRFRRLQQEVQMLLYQHPLHDARQAQGQLPVNSFWLSGCGRAQAAPSSPGITVADGLRGAALAQDWQAWADAWRELDEQILGPWLTQAAADEVVILCGERQALSLPARAQPGLTRRMRHWLQPADPAAWLARL